MHTKLEETALETVEHESTDEAVRTVRYPSLDVPVPAIELTVPESWRPIGPAVVNEMRTREYQENVRPREAEFITGLPFEINDAITLGNCIGNIIVGQDPSVGGEAYENVWWEQRADAAQRGNPPFDLDFGRFDPRN